MYLYTNILMYKEPDMPSNRVLVPATFRLSDVIGFKGHVEDFEETDPFPTRSAGIYLSNGAYHPVYYTFEELKEIIDPNGSQQDTPSSFPTSLGGA